MEIWKDIKGYEGLYQVSNRGNVKRINRIVKSKHGNKKMKDIVMKQEINKSNYMTIGLTKEGKRKHFNVSRLVAINFIENIYGKKEVNHINGNKHDNSSENLEWVTKRENMNHAKKNGLMRIGEKHGRSKLKDFDVLEIRELYLTGCYSQRAIAKKYNVTQSAICSILNNKVWKHI